MTKELWITAGTSAKILEERFGRPIRVDYVTKLGKANRIRTKHMESRIVLYNRNDVETIQIKQRGKPTESVNSALVTDESTLSTPTLQGGSEGHSSEDVQKEVDPAA